MTLNNQEPDSYSVEQIPSPGTALDEKKLIEYPIFSPIKIRDLVLNNRYVVSPMCTYSSQDGFMTDWHLVHYGQFALHGAGLVMMEATGVTENGRISPSCSGIWKDEHILNLKRINKYIHNQGGKVGIQLAHAGRKASTLPPFHANSRGIAKPELGGWANVVGPSPLAWDNSMVCPIELNLEQVKETILAFKEGARRALEAGFDVIDIHGAHGYLIHQFLSPVSNKRSDQYGGSFENRIRFIVEIVEQVRQVWPSHKPLFVRLSCTDWIDQEESWDLNQSIELSKILYKLGVDLVDCSSSGSSPIQKIPAAPGFQVPFAAEIKKNANGLLTGAVGLITKPDQGNEIIVNQQADLIFMAREFLRNPSFVLKAGHYLNVNIKYPHQYERGIPSPRYEPF